jgi:hypothetical protein
MNVNNIRLSVGNESTPGTSVVPTAMVPISKLPTLDQKATRKEDDIITGAAMSAGEYLVATNVNGNIELSPRACAGFAKIVKAHLGLETMTAQVGGILRIRYKGAQPSCKLVVTSTTISSYLGPLGAEALDAGVGAAGFGTAGVITLSGYATLAALQAYINTFSNYVCDSLYGLATSPVMGNGAAPTTTPGPVAIAGAQAASKYVYIFFQSTTSGVYAHTFQPDNSINERPSLSLQVDNRGDNFLYAGCYIDTLQLSAAMQAQVGATATILGFTEAIGQAASPLAQPTAKPMFYTSASVCFNGQLFNFVRQVTFKSDNKMFANGYGAGGLYTRQYVLKTAFQISGDLTIKLDPSSYAVRPNLLTGAQIPINFAFTGGQIGGSLLEMMLVEIPYASIDTYEFTDNSGMLDAKIGYKGFLPNLGGFAYDAPLSVTLITTDSAIY